MNFIKNTKETIFSELFKSEIKGLVELKKAKKVKIKIFLDMLHIKIEQFSPEFLSSLNTFHFDVKPQGHGLRCEIFINERSIFFSIVHYFHEEVTTHLQINPKQFKSMNELLELIELVIGDKLDTDNHTIKRVDIAFLADGNLITPHLISTTSRVKWKRGTVRYTQTTKEFYQGEETGFRTNSRGSNYSAYIENAKKVKSKKSNHLTVESSNEEILTKFEYQVRANDLKNNNIKTMFDLKNLGSDKIFSKLEFIDPTLGFIHSTKDISKFKNFQTKVLTKGYHQARINLNKSTNRNFHRIYGSLLVPLTLKSGKMRLHSYLKLKFKKWLSEWSNENYLSPYEGKEIIFSKSPNEFQNEESLPKYLQ